jgi:hypothetical protein
MRLLVVTTTTPDTPTCSGGTINTFFAGFLAPALGRGESFCRIGTIGAAFLALFVVEAGFLEGAFFAGLFVTARSLANCF